MMANPRERNQRMKSLFGNVDPEELAKHSPPPVADQDKRRVGSSAVKSMDRAFVSIEEENRRLHDQLLSSEQIIELDPEKILPSFINDRIEIESDPSFETFVDSIRENGQKLPILVRPLDSKPGFYQAAYGHRRLRACQILKRPVKAVIRTLSDEELVISQGVENSERLNLSFIEQGLFALALKDRGYSRETISTALGRRENQVLSYVSALTNTAILIPEHLARLIGSAPSVGRPKWEKLGSLIRDRELTSRQQSLVDGLRESAVWNDSDSDKRFAMVLKALDQSAKTEPAILEVPVSGGAIIVAKRAGPTTRISIPDNHLPGLSEWLLQRLPELVEEFQANQGKDSDMS
ncbi:plasmid partitioning protein RepB [Neorhizobium alkalisoli]|jgi:ParB family chromosome partitioning protein|uniref:ParB family chromosome partitioning protein n=1 Tax=Neorhizobium alkalisoli TaxID=528178 RepID=A0A561QB53_9HYPH|nr:ParB family chromosome partitioning protein [Neorhizobium alkalisoli]